MPYGILQTLNTTNLEEVLELSSPKPVVLLTRDGDVVWNNDDWNLWSGMISPEIPQNFLKLAFEAGRELETSGHREKVLMVEFDQQKHHAIVRRTSKNQSVSHRVAVSLSIISAEAAGLKLFPNGGLPFRIVRTSEGEVISIDMPDHQNPILASRMPLAEFLGNHYTFDQDKLAYFRQLLHESAGQTLTCELRSITQLGRDVWIRTSARRTDQPDVVAVGMFTEVSGPSLAAEGQYPDKSARALSIEMNGALSAIRNALTVISFHCEQANILATECGKMCDEAQDTLQQADVISNIATHLESLFVIPEMHVPAELGKTYVVPGRSVHEIARTIEDKVMNFGAIFKKLVLVPEDKRYASSVSDKQIEGLLVKIMKDMLIPLTGRYLAKNPMKQSTNLVSLVASIHDHRSNLVRSMNGRMNTTSDCLLIELSGSKHIVKTEAEISAVTGIGINEMPLNLCGCVIETLPTTVDGVKGVRIIIPFDGTK
jgi:hypothetical protein